MLNIVPHVHSQDFQRWVCPAEDPGFLLMGYDGGAEGPELGAVKR